MEIRKTTPSDLDVLAGMARHLWPGHEDEELKGEMAEILASERHRTFFAVADGNPVAFITVSIRHEHVEGNRFSPVAYLEGIYVETGFRGQGLGRALLHTAAEWGKEMGCRKNQPSAASSRPAISSSPRRWMKLPNRGPLSWPESSL